MSGLFSLVEKGPLSFFLYPETNFSNIRSNDLVSRETFRQTFFLRCKMNLSIVASEGIDHESFSLYGRFRIECKGC